jgi:hypothetical protein
VSVEDWFLTSEERGNPVTELPVWCDGNLAAPLVHGAAYFDRLAAEVEALAAGDQLFFTDWAVPAYRMVYDPDGCPWRARRRRTW